MLARFLALVAMVFVATAAQAWDLSPDFKQMGTMTLEIDGEAHEMVVAWNTKQNSGMARESEVMSSKMVHVFGGVVSPTGVPYKPQASFSFLMTGDNPSIASMSVMDGVGKTRFLDLGGDGTSARFESFSYSESKKLTGRIVGALVPVEKSRTGLEPIEGSSPVSFELVVDVSLIEPK